MKRATSPGRRSRCLGRSREPDDACVSAGNYNRFMFSQRTGWQLAWNRFTVALEQHRRSGRELLDLTASNPTTVGLTYNRQEILAALGNPEMLLYRPEPKGLPSARAAVAQYYRQHAPEFVSFHEPSVSSAAATQRAAGGARDVDIEQMFLTVSTSEAYSFVLRLLCDPGDEILVPSPSYPLFEFLADLNDVCLVPYTLFYDHGWHVDLHSIEMALTPRSRAIVIVHPNNPTGSYLKPAETAQLTALCVKHDLALLVDEVFLDYVIPDAVTGPGQPLSGADEAGKRTEDAAQQQLLSPSFAFHRGALTFTLSGVSKISGLPQMKLAWIVVSGPADLARSAISRLEVIADTYLSQNAPIQLAAPQLLREGQSIREQLSTRILGNLAELDSQLARQLVCERLQVEGGWYVVLRVPARGSDEDMVISLLEEQHVLVQPGYFYDFPGDGYLVLSLITPPAEFREGVSRLLSAIR